MHNGLECVWKLVRAQFIVGGQCFACFPALPAGSFFHVAGTCILVQKHCQMLPCFCLLVPVSICGTGWGLGLRLGWDLGFPSSGCMPAGILCVSGGITSFLTMPNGVPSAAALVLNADKDFG
jgi:hypothetical protein